MSKDKEILAHLAQGESQRHTAAALHVSRNTVAKVATAAKHLSLSPAQMGQNGRSRYYHDLYRQFHVVAADDLTETLRQAYPLAEAVVDLCYCGGGTAACASAGHLF